MWRATPARGFGPAIERFDALAADGDDLCRIQVPPSAFPVEATVTVEESGQLSKKTAFFVRIGNGTREIADPVERSRYIATRWGSGQTG